MAKLIGYVVSRMQERNIFRGITVPKDRTGVKTSVIAANILVLRWMLGTRVSFEASVTRKQA